MQRITNDDLMRRARLRRSVQNLQSNINGHKRIATPFRAVMGLDDYLSRKNYSCGGSTLLHQGMFPGMHGLHFGSNPSQCDSSGVEAAMGVNPHFVSPTSDYTAFKADMAVAGTTCKKN